MRIMLRHLRHHAVGYAALVASLGGTAYAANTIGSAQIADETILSEDVKNGQVLSADAGVDSLTANDIAAGAAGAAEINDGSVYSAEIGPDSLTGADIYETSLASVPQAGNGTRALHMTQIAASSVDVIRQFKLPDSHVVIGRCSTNATPSGPATGASIAIKNEGTTASFVWFQPTANLSLSDPALFRPHRYVIDRGTTHFGIAWAEWTNHDLPVHVVAEMAFTRPGANQKIVRVFLTVTRQKLPNGEFMCEAVGSYALAGL